MICYNCRGEGHRAAECPEGGGRGGGGGYGGGGYGGGRGGGFGGGGGGGGRGGCYNCGKPGHLVSCKS